MLINHTSKQVTAKIVYYGTGLGGKTTNLQYIFSVTNPRTRGELVSMETEIERTLFFDLLPINVGLLKGYQTKFQLYTVPGQVFYDSTRKLVLKGADGIVFVADSQELMEQANLESFQNLKENLGFHNLDIDKIPLVFQYNKRDLKSILSVEKLDQELNHLQRPCIEAVACAGRGVLETLRDISSLTLVKIKEALEHATVSRQKLAVHFDTDPKHQMLKMEDLPMKKVSIETIPTAKLDPAAPPNMEAVAQADAVASNEKAQQIKASKQAFSELLGKLEDPTRLTKIEKISGADDRMVVEIKDRNGRLLRSLHIELTPETKKVSIILDVKD